MPLFEAFEASMCGFKEARGRGRCSFTGWGPACNGMIRPCAHSVYMLLGEASTHRFKEAGGSLGLQTYDDLMMETTSPRDRRRPQDHQNRGPPDQRSGRRGDWKTIEQLDYDFGKRGNRATPLEKTGRSGPLSSTFLPPQDSNRISEPPRVASAGSQS